MLIFVETVYIKFEVAFNLFIMTEGPKISKVPPKQETYEKEKIPLTNLFLKSSPRSFTKFKINKRIRCQEENINNTTMMEQLSLSERLSGERPERSFRTRPSRSSPGSSIPRRHNSAAAGEHRRPSVVDTLKDKVLTLSGGKYQKKRLSVRKDQLARLVAQELCEMED